MSGRRRLSQGNRGFSRVLGRAGAEARLDGLLRLEAGRVCVAWVQFRAATEALQGARRTRRDRKGRRPGGRELERLSRRQGLADATYNQALDRFRELAASSRKLPSVAEAL